MVALKNEGHRHHSGTHWVLSSSRASIDGFHLLLEFVVENLSPVLAQKDEQLPSFSAALEEILFSSRDSVSGVPTLDGHLDFSASGDASTRSRIRSIVDPRPQLIDIEDDSN
jgi:hypothetical protein